MDIESKIKEIAETYWKGYGFVLEDKFGVDREVDNAELPAIVCYLVESGTLNFRNGRVKDSEDVVMAFIDKVDMDADGYDNLTVYTRMKALAVEFIGKIMACGYFEPMEKDVEYKPIYEELASNVSGVMCMMTLKEKTGRCV